MGCEDKELDIRAPQWGCPGFNPGRRVRGTVVPIAAATPQGLSPRQMEIPVLGVCQRMLQHTRDVCSLQSSPVHFLVPSFALQGSSSPRSTPGEAPAAPGLGSDEGSLPHCTWPNHPGASYAKTESISYVFHGLYDVSGNSWNFFC